MSDDDEDQAVTLAAAGAPAAAVAPVLAGTFAIYETPDGGYCLVTEIPGRGVEQRVIPGKFVRLASSGAGMKMFGRLLGGMGEG